jgi:putative Mn2+ efflux pump MntP
MVAMNTFKVLFLALALVFSSWSIYLNAGIVLRKAPLLRKFYFTGIMFLLQFVMAGTGIWLGYKVGSFEERTNMLISLSILLIFGLKVLLTGIKTPAADRAFNITDNKVTMFAALAEGITPLSIGIAIGLLSSHPYLHWFLIGIFIFSGILTALFLAGRMGNNSLKLRLGPVGGLLMLAAAIQLAINLTRF